MVTNNTEVLGQQIDSYKKYIYRCISLNIGHVTMKRILTWSSGSVVAVFSFQWWCQAFCSSLLLWSENIITVKSSVPHSVIVSFVLGTRNWNPKTHGSQCGNPQYLPIVNEWRLERDRACDDWVPSLCTQVNTDTTEQEGTDKGEFVFGRWIPSQAWSVMFSWVTHLRTACATVQERQCGWA